MAIANFDSTKQPLQEILSSVGKGETQLPDFQRGWVWDDEHIKSLIASLSLSFPIGTVMTLDTGSADITFKPRPIEGTDDQLQQVEPETLILDGQQRLTSLFQSLRSGRAVETRDAKGKKDQAVVLPGYEEVPSRREGSRRGCCVSSGRPPCDEGFRQRNRTRPVVS